MIPNVTPDQQQQVETRYFSLRGLSRAKYMEEVKKVSIPLARHLALASQTRRKATRTAWETVKQKFIATPISNLPQGEFIMGGWHGSVSQNRQVAILVNEFDNVHAVSGSWVRDAKPASKAL